MKNIKYFFNLLSLFFLFSCDNTETQITTINITEYKQENSKGILIDVRKPEEFVEGHLPNAININVLADDFADKMENIKKKETVYLYCKSGIRSTKATKILDTLGYKNIFNLDGGFLAWEEAGKVIEK